MQETVAFNVSTEHRYVFIFTLFHTALIKHFQSSVVTNLVGYHSHAVIN